MKRAILLLVAAWMAYAQTPDPAITFEVASVKEYPLRSLPRSVRLGCNGGPGTSDPGRFTCASTVMGDLLRQAFDLQSYQLPASDSASARYVPSPGVVSTPAGIDIVANVPAGATKEQFRTMLQNLLIERFKLSYHYEKKDAEVYDLVVAKNGPKLIASEGAERATTPPPGKIATDASGCPDAAAAAGRHGAVSSIFNFGRLVCVGGYDAPIGELVRFLSEVLGRLVNDATGLKGKYDFSFGFTSDSLQSAPRAGPTSMDGGAPELDFGPSIFAAIQDRYGLRLEKRKGSIEVFVIDHVEKVPTEN